MRRKWLLLTIIPTALIALLARADAPPPKSNGKSATVVVRLPATAKLYVEGAECPLKSGTRTFRTDPLEPGKKYEYTLHAEIEQNKRTVGVTLTALVKAGETTEVQFGDEKAFLAAGGVGTITPTPPAVAPTRFPAGLPPWLVTAYLDRDGDVAWNWLADPVAIDPRGSLSTDEFATKLVSGAALKPADVKERLKRRTVVAIAADAKPVDPFYLNLLAPETIVIVDKKPFPGLRATPAPTVIFGTVGPGAEKTRVRWMSVASAPAADEDNAVFPGEQVRVVRAAISEQAVELSHTDLIAYDVDGDRLTPAQLVAIVEKDTPVILLDAGRKPSTLLLKALKKDRRVLVLPVGFRGP